MLRKLKKLLTLVVKGDSTTIKAISKNYLRHFKYALLYPIYWLMNLQKPTKIMSFPIPTQGEAVLGFCSFMSSVLTKEMCEGKTRAIFVFDTQELSTEKAEQIGNMFLIDKIKSLSTEMIKDCIIVDKRENPFLFWWYNNLFWCQFFTLGPIAGCFDDFIPLEKNPICPISFFTQEEKARGDSIIQEILGGGAR